VEQHPSQAPPPPELACRRGGGFKGRKKALNVNQVDQLRKILAAGKTKVEAARELGISRETVYAYLRGTP
jgi:hypothetical protein